jgi:hypothetical protein
LIISALRNYLPSEKIVEKGDENISNKKEELKEYEEVSKQRF